MLAFVKIYEMRFCNQLFRFSVFFVAIGLLSVPAAATPVVSTAAVNAKPPNSSSERKKARGAEEHYRMGVVAYIKGENAKSLSYFAAALKIRPDHVLANRMVEKIKRETDTNRLKEAKKMYTQGLTQYMSGYLDGAITLWESALELDPYNSSFQKALDRARAETRERSVP